MSTTSWRKSPSVIAHLTDNPYQYQFLQAVRLLQRVDYVRASELATQQLSPTNSAEPKSGMRKRLAFTGKSLEIAQYAPSSKEFIRFRTEQSLSFAQSEITKIAHASNKSDEQDQKQWHLTIAFMGLTGVSGVLPYHYSETMLQQLKSKNISLLEFLELFNHRTISLFYRASTKYRLPIQYEKNNLGISKNKKDDFTQSLLSLIGLGTQHLNNRLITDDDSLIRYSGLFSQSVRTTSGLNRMLSEHFGFPFTIEEFQGQWQELLPDLRSRLTSKQYRKGLNVSLGKDAKLGRKGWFLQGKISVNIGPLNKEEFKMLEPGSKKLTAIKELVRFYVGIEQDFEINIKLKRADLSEKLILGKKEKPILGWNSWFANKRPDKIKNQTINIRVSEQG